MSAKSPISSLETISAWTDKSPLMTFTDASSSFLSGNVIALDREKAIKEIKESKIIPNMRDCFCMSFNSPNASSASIFVTKTQPFGKHSEAPTTITPR